jgi:DNA topoisomerase-3
MDKFKTSEMGRALKKVFRNEIAVNDSVELAKDEIRKYFSVNELPIEEDTDMGYFGDDVGICPLCGSQVKRGKYGYGCMGYKEGCKFKIGSFICGRAISLSNVKLLLETGRTSKIRGFISQKGNTFDAYLKLSEGRCVFDFDDRSRQNQ